MVLHTYPRGFELSVIVDIGRITVYQYVITLMENNYLYLLYMLNYRRI